MVNVPAPTPRHKLINGRWQIPIDELKVEKKAELAEARWKDEVAPFEYKGHHFDTSERSQIKYLSVKAPTVWKTYDGWIQMDMLDFTALVNNYEAHVKALFEKEQLLCLAVESATTQLELDTIKWNT